MKFSFKLLYLCLFILLASCEEVENCEDEESVFFRDLCWTDKAIDSNDVSICSKIDNMNFACVGKIAANLKNPLLCEQHAEDKKSCMNIYTTELLENKIKTCNDMDELNLQVCITDIAKSENNYTLCLRAPDLKLCTIDFAVEERSPEAILINLNIEERDMALGLYAYAALDDGAWTLIKDNRMHDFSVIQAPIVAFIWFKKTVALNYCDEMLRGNYEYDANEIPGSEEQRNENLCYIVAAATESASADEDLCMLRLSLNIKSYDEEEKDETLKDAVLGCQGLYKKLQAAEKLDSATDFEEYEKLMDIVKE